nr:hypothetical protein [Balneola vulgaris]
MTGDHGNDPCSDCTDHSREFVPLQLFPHKSANSIDLGIRDTFSDIAVSVAEYFNLSHSMPGKSFLRT